MRALEFSRSRDVNRHARSSAGQRSTAEPSRPTAGHARRGRPAALAALACWRCASALAREPRRRRPRGHRAPLRPPCGADAASGPRAARLCAPRICAAAGPWTRFAGGPRGRVASGPAPGEEHAHHHHPEGRHELQLVAPPIGRKISTPVKMPRTPIQRGSRPTRIGAEHHAIIPAASASPAQQIERSREHVRRCPWSARCSTAWAEKSWPTTNLCVSIALTTWWTMLTSATADPADEHQRTGQRARSAGRRKRVASSSSSRISVRPTIANAASKLPAISGQGVVADEFDLGRARADGRVRDARERRCEALQQPDGRRAVERRGDDDRAEQVQERRRRRPAR